MSNTKKSFGKFPKLFSYALAAFFSTRREMVSSEAVGLLRRSRAMQPRQAGEREAFAQSHARLFITTP